MTKELQCSCTATPTPWGPHLISIKMYQQRQCEYALFQNKPTLFTHHHRIIYSSWASRTTCCERTPWDWPFTKSEKLDTSGHTQFVPSCLSTDISMNQKFREFDAANIHCHHPVVCQQKPVLLTRDAWQWHRFWWMEMMPVDISLVAYSDDSYSSICCFSLGHVRNHALWREHLRTKSMRGNLDRFEEYEG